MDNNYHRAPITYDTYFIPYNFKILYKFTISDTETINLYLNTLFPGLQLNITYLCLNLKYIHQSTCHGSQLLPEWKKLGPIAGALQYILGIQA